MSNHPSTTMTPPLEINYYKPHRNTSLPPLVVAHAKTIPPWLRGTTIIAQTTRKIRVTAFT